jgi:V/A-type H+-transporting ATPase subunit I
MIARMRKTFVAASATDRDDMLKALRALGVVHVAPVDPARAVAEERTLAAIDSLARAVLALRAWKPAGVRPRLSPHDAAVEVLAIATRSAERRSRLVALHRQVEQLALWGDVRLDTFQGLAAAGVTVQFYSVPAEDVGQVRADFVEVVGDLPGKRVLAAVVLRRIAAAEVPDSAEAMPLPQRDRPSLRAEAAEIDAALTADGGRMGELAHLAGGMEAEQARLRREGKYTAVSRSGIETAGLYAIQGWVPSDRAADLSAGLSAAGLSAAVATREPAAEEEPPTLLAPPWWARPLVALLKVLGTVPGYREFDVSVAFMIFLPAFSAILISDAGYGLLYLLAPCLMYRRMKASGTGSLAQLIMVVGLLSMVWGVVTCSFFGFDISRLFGRSQAWVSVDMKKESMDFLMLMSVTIGAVHLSLAHLWKAKAAWPSLSAAGELGWSIWLWGIYGLVNMFLLGGTFDWNTAPYYPWLLAGGGAMAILFAAPSRNPLKMLGLGLANFPLSAIGTFGDTVSYLRLMAIGLGGSALAGTFNQMGTALPWYGMIPVLLIGHALNVALSIVSLLAHGVRLNMLEFSNNLGMQWSGYAYEPFGNRAT